MNGAPSDFDLATVLDAIVALAVVAGVVFGLAELRHATRSRRDHAAVDIVRTVQTQEVRQAVERVLKLPNDADPAVIRSDPAMLEAALAVDSACEMWGSMVFEGVVDQHMLDRMVGGWVRGTWSRLRRWVEAERADNRNPNVGEWWQWLYERLEADPDPGKAQAAYIAYRGKAGRQAGDGGQGGDSGGGGGGDQSGGGGGDQGGGGTTQEPMITPSPIGEYEIREGDRGRIVEEGR